MTTPDPMLRTGPSITEEEFGRLLASFQRCAFRLELQRAYREPTEVDTISRFAAGDPQDPTEVPSLRAWYAQVRTLTAGGRRIDRVRVQDEPPTATQRWERWIGRWNSAAGETLRYLTRRRAYEIGLLPAADDLDWWLLDDELLVVMWFDAAGNRIHTQTMTDPELVQQALTWQNLAVRHAVPDSGAHDRPPTFES